MDVKLSRIERICRSCMQHYNPKKYWERRNQVIDSTCRVPKILRLYLLYYIKRCDAYNHASLGTHLGYGATFDSPPSFPHGLYNIIISHNVHIGRNATIYHGVTIGEGNGGAPTIGNNCCFGAYAIVIGGIHIGDNVNIGAGCIVTHDVPDNRTVVMQSPRIITLKEE